MKALQVLVLTALILPGPHLGGQARDSRSINGLYVGHYLCAGNEEVAFKLALFTPGDRHRKRRH